MAGLAQIAKIMKAVGAGESVAPQALKILRASEALGPYEGKVLNVTSTNRALYGSNNGKNRSGALFSRQQLIDPNFGQSVWGLAKPNKATAMVNASTPETVWSTYIGAPEQLRGDPSILQDALHEFHANVDQLTPETRQALNSHFVKNGLVPKGFDIGTDALAIDPYSMTFETRTKMADALGSGTGLGRVPQKTIIDMPGIIARNSDPMMEGLPNFSVGSQLFTLNGRKTFRPDLNADFPHQVEGNNLDVTFLPAPVEHALPDLHAKVLADIASGKRAEGNMITDFDLRGYGKQPITHDMLMGLDKAGHKQGGVVHAGAGGWMKALQAATNVGEKVEPAIEGAAKVLPAAERDANLAKMLEGSATKKRLYHGTTAHDEYVDQSGQAFNQFVGKPTWLAEDPYTASGYSAGTGSTYPVHAQIKKPLVLNFDANDEAKKALPIAKRFGVDVDHLVSTRKPENAWEVINDPAFVDAVEAAGHDGYVINEDGYKTYGVFDPRKIKSATGNRGTYDTTKPDLNEAAGGSINKGRHWMEALKHAKSSNSATGNPWHVALKKAQHMAIGGPVLGPQDTKPDISDGGNMIQDGAFAKGGTVRHFEDGGYTDPLSIPDAPVSEDTRQSIADVGRALKAQYEREKAQLKKQGGVKDLALQTGSVLAGQLPEMANWLQTKVPALSKPESVLPMSGKQFEKVEADRVPKVKLPDTEAINDAMREAGMTENDYPLLSNAASLFAPAGLSKIASLTKGLPVGASILDVSKAAPALESGVKQGIKYATRQDGPFFRVTPSTTEGTSAADRGVREILSQPSADTSGAGQVRNKIAQFHSPEDVEGLMQPESNIALQAADQYSRKNMGRPFAKLTIPESSLSKQSPIATTFMAAVEGFPEYKQAVFDAYKRQMPKVINKAGAKDYDDLMKKAYEQIAKETDEQFKHLPVNMSYHRAGEGNYVSSQEMLSDVHGNKHLYVFQGGDEHPFLNAVDPATGLNQNEKFRAVHDFFGHGIDGNQFGPKGEEQAFADHSQMYSPLARIALASETRGQNSVVNYSPLNAELKKQLAILDQQAYDAKRAGNTEKYNQIKADRKAAFNDLQFAPNVPVVLPPEFIDPMFSGGMPSYLNGIIKPPQGSTTSSVLTHYSHSPDLQQTNPAFYGTGIKGREAERLQAKDAVKNRTYFYLGEPGEVRPEPGLGINKYRTESDNLYDLSADPLKLRTLAAEANRTPWTAKYNNGITDATQNLNDVERMIKEHGFSGYISPETKAAAVFEPMKVKKQARGGLAALAQ